jgi:hypothetical protein
MSNIPAFIITIIVAVLAVGALVFAIITLSPDSVDDDPINRPPEIEETIEELFITAKELVKNNFEVYQLFYTIEFNKDLHFEQFYSNPPEPIGGYYLLKPGVLDFDSVDDIFDFVRDTFTKEEADRIISIGAYKDIDGRIGVNADFTPTGYDFALSEDITIELESVSDNEVTITIIFGEDEGSTDRDMQKKDGVWRLPNLIPLP